MFKRSLLFALSLISILGATPVLASTVVNVPATGDLYAAGVPSGINCCAGDSTPANSPVLAPLTLVSGEYLTFTTTGNALHQKSGPPNATADGETAFFVDLSPSYYYQSGPSQGSSTGISGPTHVHLDGLAGVFLSDAGPTTTAPAPLSGTTFSSIAPGLNQIFFIGDGLTGDGTGTGDLQTFFVPTGATRLYLGIIDDGGYFDNTGAYLTTIDAVLPTATGPAGVPEPTSIALLGIGVAGLAATRRRSKR